MTVSGNASGGRRALLAVFWAQVAAVVLVLAWILIEPLRDWSGRAFVPMLFVCLTLGVALLVLAIRWKERGLLRTFLILTGASTTGLALGSVLHNLLDALGMVTERWRILNGAIGVLSAAMFLLAIPVSPLGFLTGVIGAIAVVVREAREPTG